MSDGEPGAGEGRPSDDEMTGNDSTDPSPDEAARGHDALRELRIAPLPADVLARLEGRLEAELGRPAQVRRRRPRLAFAVPGAAIALASAVVVIVLATQGHNPTTPKESAFSTRSKASSPLAPKATAGASAQDSVARVKVPALVGLDLDAARSLARVRGLRVTLAPPACPDRPATPIRRQQPGAGARALPGTAIRVTLARCGS